MKRGGPQSFGGKLKAFRETAGYTQEELATIAGLSADAISALERGERRRPHLEPSARSRQLWIYRAPPATRCSRAHGRPLATPPSTN